MVSLKSPLAGFDVEALEAAGLRNGPEEPKQGWYGLGSLHDLYSEFDEHWKFADTNMEEWHRDIARLLLWDIKRFSVWPRNAFMRDVMDIPVSQMSNGQLRGVLNVICGSISANRRRFRKSRYSRVDRDKGRDQCVVCGGPLNDDASWKRGAGLTCYKKTLQIWMSES